MLLKNTLTATALSLGILTATMNVAQAVPINADIVFIVDESGSMAGEHAWLTNMVTDLELGLAAAGVGSGGTANNYALVGYGATSTHTSLGSGGHSHTVGGSDWGTASDLSTATGSLVTSGGFEDGWQAINYFFDNYSLTAEALNIVLITDEDRDNGSSDTFDSTLQRILDEGGLLNSVINCRVTDSSGINALGFDGTDSYVADGAGGFTSSAGGTTCGNTSDDDYGQMALDTGGAMWDLNQLRSGGSTATSFTNAFVDIKVEEIVNGDVPEPATLALFSFGLLGLGFVARRRKIS